MTTSTSRLSPLRRSILWLSLFSFVTQPLGVLAQVVAAPNGGVYKPTVDAAGNGVPVVQITAPSAAGVSRNQYQQFNVAAPGLILNNSQNLVQTQQAGWIAGNPNLSGTSARVIVNEVTSTNPSSLRGYTEVAGSAAEVVIANPNGITCNGCGFINTPRAVLTTGTPEFGAGGSLEAYRVTGGSIAIEGAGLNASNIDRVDIIARAVQVNAGLWAGELNVVTGANLVNHADLGFQTIVGTGGQPTVAIDVAALGGMYANKIRLIGTEAGVGVRSLGTLATQAGDFTLDAQGQITLGGNIGATGNIAVTSAADIVSGGTLSAQQNIALASGGTLTQSGAMTARGNLTLGAHDIDASGALGAGVDSNGQATLAGNLVASATGSLRLAGQNLAGNAIVVSGDSLDLSGAQTLAGADISLIANGDIDHRGGSLAAVGNVVIAGQGTLQNDGGSIRGTALDLTSGGLSNRGGSISAQQQTRIVAGGAIDNGSNGSVGGYIGGDSLVISTQGSLGNTGGRIEAAQNISIAAGENFAK